jgi:arylsulfatase A-like enzyme
MVDEPVALMDLVPTLLDLLTVPAPAELRGETLLPLLNGRSRGPEQVIPTMAGGQTPYQEVVRLGKWKLIHVPSEKDRQVMTGREFELYNLKDDPGEKVNLIDKFPEKADLLKKHLPAAEQNAKGLPSEPEPAIEHDQFSTEMLKSLGYIQ